jgi:molybdopterin-containing oxidoreductase family iron-sulfur binding subunit
MGASLALAGASSCRWQEDKMMPMTRRPEGYIPGESRQYATAVEIGDSVQGLLAQSYDGRPVKLEGHPSHPDNKGACGAIAQAGVLELYDPERSRSPAAGGQDKTWPDAEGFVRTHFDNLKEKQGAGLRVLSEPSRSPTLMRLRKKLLEEYPQAQWIEWNAAAGDAELEGTKLAFGKRHRTHFDLSGADVVVALDADFIRETYPGGLSNASALMERRNPDGKMNRVYAVEGVVSLVGTIADHRLPLRSELIKAFAAALDATLGGDGAQPKPAAQFLNSEPVSRFLTALVKDLNANKGRSLIVAGPRQPAEVHALVARMNAALGNIGKTVFYSAGATEDATPARMESFGKLVEEMRGGRVDTLLMLGTNPVYDAPVDLGFAEALVGVKNSIHLSLYRNETSQKCHWHLPRAHWLEAWGDVVSHDGRATIAQPLIAPLFTGRSAIELLAFILGENDAGGMAQLKQTHAGMNDKRRFARAVHDGMTGGPALERGAPELGDIKALSFAERELGADGDLANGQLELVFLADGKTYDGRFANNAWLQELPEPISKLTWGNAALIGPTTANALGVADGDHVTLTLDGKSITLPAMVIPGQAAGSVAVALGYGRTAAGTVGGDDAHGIAAVGANAYSLRSSKAMGFSGGLTVKQTGTVERLATTQDVHSIDQLGREGAEKRLPMLVREGTVEQYTKEPEFAKHAVHHPPLLNLWQPPVAYEGYKWGMTIDLSRCIGCSACVTACQAENNIPAVGKENVVMGREMLWLRVDRYFRGTPERPEFSWQPLPCQQCENAPCEQVCPVGATMHSSEGLNDMVYNRCIGTRYCANNCPYKVRRFNYFNYRLDIQAETPFQGFKDDHARVKAMVFNPEVSVRGRGVMEKCTFCVQRIQKAKITAKNARRRIEDGEVRTACQQACPTGTIQFGDLNDGGAKVTQHANSPRAYGMLEELNNRPRVRYLARIKNPNPELV